MTQVKGYFDRVPTITGHTEMMERLAQRTKGKVMPDAGTERQLRSERPTVVDAGVASAENTLEWLPAVRGMEAILSACGRYSVARCRVNGVATYQAWLRVPAPQMLGGPQDVAEKAKHIAEAHSNG